MVLEETVKSADRLGGAIRGRVIAPQDEAYDRARRTHNAAADPRPAVIVRPLDAEDVASVIAHARSTEVLLVVRAGGHSMANHSTGDGALVLDLSAMRDIDIDLAGRTAWADAGVLAGEYTDATYAHGLVTPFGDTGSVGIAGLTLGGGMGWLVRKHGLTIDSLLAVEIVTADGRQRIVSEDEEPDLFWAVRGAGANFGVVTRLRFRLHPLGDVLAGGIVLPATNDVLGSLIPVLLAAPDELTAMPVVALADPDPAIPEAHHGRPVVHLSVAWSGSAEAGERAIGPLRALATPLRDTVTWKPYSDLFGPVDRDVVPTWGVASRALFIDAFDEATIEVIRRRLEEPGAPPAALVQLRVLGGQVGRLPNDGSAFGWRDRSALLWIITPYEDLDRADEHEAWTAAFRAELGVADAATYVNFMGAEDGEAVTGAYPARTYARLRALKRRYDPDNLFRANHNIQPA